MELRSGRRLRRSPPPDGPRSHRMDLISSLPDEILLLVLARIGCIRAAVQTSLLSRRWRGLWSGLTDLTFRGLAPAMIEALFPRFAASPQVSTLDMVLPRTRIWLDTAGANSLLRASLLLSPRKLLFTFQPDIGYDGDIELPCFHGTTSIEIDTAHFDLKPLLPGEFNALESLTVKAKITDLASLLTCCPRLRVLRVTCPDKYLFRITQPPAREFPMLEEIFLTGRIVDLDSLIHRCRRLRVLSVTQIDTCLLQITLPPSTGEFSMLEKLSLSGNIADLGTLLHRSPRLRVLGVTFHGAMGTVKEGLAALEEAAPLGLVLSHLGIAIPWRDDSMDAACFAFLLSTVARRSPKELAFKGNFEGCSWRMMVADRRIQADLPCFPNAKSIEMTMRNVFIAPLPTGGEFLVLERLSFSRECCMIDIGTLVPRCPRLRELKVVVAMRKITVHSALLHKLDVSIHGRTTCQGIDIVTLVLKQLHLNVRARMDIGVSISAPPVEHVSWHRSYTDQALPLLFGSWQLRTMSVHTKERNNTCWQHQLPQFHVMCLYLSVGNDLDAQLNFAQEMDKLPVTNFSALELNFASDWHVYGALVLQLLRVRRICATAKKLKVIMPWFPKARRACPSNCPCENPKNWRNQSVIYTTLEEVEMHGFNGEDHELDFFRLILQCSPILKSVIVRPSHKCEGWATQLSNIFLAHPSVKYYWFR